MESKAPPVRQFKINRTSFTRHYEVLRPDGTQLYYVDQSAFTKDKPNLTFHEGNDAKGPIVAVSHMPRFSFDCKVGLGDPSLSSSAGNVNIQWEDLTRKSVNASEFHWAMTCPPAAGAPSAMRRNFVWKRTHKVGAEGAAPSAVTFRNFKLLDGETDELLAVFTSDRGWSTCGVLQVNVDYGREFDIMVLATMVSLYEKARKRAARSGAAGGLPAATFKDVCDE